MIRPAFSMLLVSMLSAVAVANEPLIVAHRGASAEAPENTLPAFKLAWEQQADCIEGDFYLSKDGKVVCIHDSSTKRTGDKSLAVKSASLAELQQLDVGLWKGAAFRGTRIPTIAEVFATIPDGKKIYVEVKCGPEIVPELLKEIKASSLEPEQIVVISFNNKVIQEVKTKAPQFKAFWLCSFKKNALGQVSPSAKAVLASLEKCGADGLGSSSSIPRETAETILANDLEWHVWTVDDPKQAERFRQWGAMSITTNRPGLLREQRTSNATP